MNKKIAGEFAIMLILLVVIAVGGVFWFQNEDQRDIANAPQLEVKQSETAQDPPLVQPTSLCTDTDGGKNAYINGSASYKEKERGTIIHLTQDLCAKKNPDATSAVKYIEGMTTCSGADCYVLEAYCGEYNGSPIDAGEYIQCQRGCKDGACIPDPVPQY